MPLPEEVEEDEYFDVEIIEADDNEGRTLSGIISHFLIKKKKKSLEIFFLRHSQGRICC